MLREIQGIDKGLVELYFMQLTQEREELELEVPNESFEAAGEPHPFMEEHNHSRSSWDQWDATQLPSYFTETNRKIMDLLFTSKLVMWVSPLSFEQFLENKLQSCVVRGTLDLEPIRNVLLENPGIPEHEVDIFLKDFNNLQLPWVLQFPQQRRY